MAKQARPSKFYDFNATSKMKNMTLKIEIIAVGKQRETIISDPETVTISFQRQDGFSPTQPEIFKALQIALECMKPRRTLN